MIYVGLDISKKTIDAQIKEAGSYQYHKVSNDSMGWQTLAELLQDKEKENVRVCCEYTGNYYYGVANALHQAGYPVSVVNPYSIKSYARLMLTRTKTDKRDARLIVDYCETQQPPVWQPPSISTIKIKTLNRRIDQLMKMRIMEENRLQVAEETLQPSHQSMIQCLQDEIDKCRKALQEYINENREIKQRQKLLQTIPGIGEQTAAAMLSVLMDIERFKTVKHFISYIGLTPITIQSGTSVRGRSRISKMGDSYIRKTLYMPARSACLRSKVFRDWAQEHMQNGKHPKAVYTMMMRKLATYSYKVIKENQPFDASKVKSC